MARKRLKSDKLQRQVERSEKRLAERPEETNEEDIRDADKPAARIEQEATGNSR